MISAGLCTVLGRYIQSRDQNERVQSIDGSLENRDSQYVMMLISSILINREIKKMTYANSSSDAFDGSKGTFA